MGPVDPKRIGCGGSHSPVVAAARGGQTQVPDSKPLSPPGPSPVGARGVDYRRSPRDGHAGFPGRGPLIRGHARPGTADEYVLNGVTLQRHVVQLRADFRRSSRAFLAGGGTNAGEHAIVSWWICQAPGDGGSGTPRTRTTNPGHQHPNPWAFHRNVRVPARTTCSAAGGERDVVRLEVVPGFEAADGRGPLAWGAAQRADPRRMTTFATGCAGQGPKTISQFGTRGRRPGLGGTA